MITDIVGTIISFSGDSKDKIIGRTFPVKNYLSEFSFSGVMGYVGCSDPYWSVYKLNRFYFSFPRMPIWIEEIVEELNSNFNNIKINVFRNETISNPTGNIPVFSVNYRKGYPEGFRKFSSIMMHHIFRLFSYGENISGNPHIKTDVKFVIDKNRPEESVLATIVKLNNLHLGRYRKLSELDIIENDILNLDNPDLVRNALTMYPALFYSSIRQTEIIQSLKEIYENGEIVPKFKVRDKVIAKNTAIASWGDSYRTIIFTVQAININRNPYVVHLSRREDCGAGSYKTFHFEKVGEDEK